MLLESTGVEVTDKNKQHLIEVAIKSDKEKYFK